VYQRRTGPKRATGALTSPDAVGDGAGAVADAGGRASGEGVGEGDALCEHAETEKKSVRTLAHTGYLEVTCPL
jgi:hypothetical protein